MVLGVDYNITVHLITLTLARRGFVFVVAFNVLEMSCRLITHSHDLYAIYLDAQKLFYND